VEYDGLLDLARRVALEAADLVRVERRKGVEVSATKSSPVDIVTEVDKAAERLIHERLMAARPDDGFLGEEGGSSTSTSGVTWIVDPIDGTVNFLYGLPQYAISIAASIDDGPETGVVAGIVVNVESGEVFAATRGGGATCDGRPLRVRDVVPMPQRLVITGFSYVAAVRARQAAAVASLVTEVRDIRRLGSAALDLCAIAAGRADAYVEEGLNPWDVAAGGLVATEAGARLEVEAGVGGNDCVVCAPVAGYADFAALVARCGFLDDTSGRAPKRVPGNARWAAP
jgi:myo-inositol-1(or 4)-monophosphatase